MKKFNRSYIGQPKLSSCESYMVYKIQKNIAGKFGSSQEVKIPIEIVETESQAYVQGYIDKVIDSCGKYDEPVKEQKTQGDVTIEENIQMFETGGFIFSGLKQAFTLGAIGAMGVFAFVIFGNDPSISEASGNDFEQIIQDIDRNYTLEEQLAIQNEIIITERSTRDSKHEVCTIECGEDERCLTTCESKRFMGDALVREAKATKDRIQAKIMMQ